MACSQKRSDDVMQIVKSLQSVIEDSTDNCFKKKCLDIMEVDDFSRFSQRTKQKLRKLLLRNRVGSRQTMKQNFEETETNEKCCDQSHRNQHAHHSPIRKRYRKVPLLDLPWSSSKNIELDANTPIHQKACNDGKDERVNLVRTPEKSSKLATAMSPSCIDITPLCGFINGLDSNIDEWLTPPTPKTSFAHAKNTTAHIWKSPKNVPPVIVNTNIIQKWCGTSSSTVTSHGAKNFQVVTEAACDIGKPALVSNSNEATVIDEEKIYPDVVLSVEKHIASNRESNKTNSSEFLEEMSFDVAHNLEIEKDWLEEFQGVTWGDIATSSEASKEIEQVFDLDATDLFTVDSNPK